MSLKGFLTKGLIFISSLTVSASATYFICYSQKDKNNSANNNSNDQPIELTPQQKLLASLTGIKKFDLDAKVNLEYQKTIVDGAISFVGSGDVSNLQDIKLSGAFDAKLGVTSFNTNLDYFSNNIYFKFNDNYLYMPTDSILDFIDTLPSMGMNIEIPEELKNLDINKFEEDLLAMEPIKDVTGYYFTFKLNDTIDLVFTTDDNYNFTGLRTNRFYYKDLYFQLNAKLDSVESTKIELIDPSTTDNHPEYVNFAPAFNLVQGMYNLFSSKTNTVNLDVSLSKLDELTSTNNNLADLNLDITYDMENLDFHVNGTVEENANVHNIKLSLLDDVLYGNYNDALKFSLNSQTVGGLIDFLVKKINNQTLTDLLNKLSEGTNNIDIVETITNLTNLNNLITKIVPSENTLEVTIDLTTLGINLDAFTVIFDFTGTKFLGFKIDKFNYQGYNGSLALTTKDYSPLSINPEEYARLEHPLSTLENVFQLMEQTKFRLEFTGNVASTLENVKPATINGGLQFDLTDNVQNGYGYGELTILDRNEYSHNVYVDLKDKNEVLFKYNQQMKGKFKTQSVLDILDLVSELVQEKDEHFMELFGDLINSMNESEIGKILAEKNYGKLLASNLVSNLKTSASQLSIDINGKVIGLDDTFTLVVNYTYNDEECLSTIDSLEVKDLNLNTDVIEFKVSLKNFNDELETTRLPSSDDYLDFSDIKLLLRLGINTSKVNDWHLSTNVSIALGSLSIGALSNISLDIKIKNIQGKIKCAFEIDNLPYVPIVNPSKYYYPSNRQVKFYYFDDMIYGYRRENVTKTFIGTGAGVYEIYFKATLDEFMDNIIQYICKVGVSLSDSIIDQIKTSGDNSQTTTEPIHYENVLTDFSYNPEGENLNGTNYPYFKLNINLAELTKDKALSAVKLKLYLDTVNERLHGFNAALIIDVGLQISISATATLVDFGEVLDLSYIDEYAQQHAQDENKTIYEKFTKN